jgi:hypothetical protein
MHTPLTSFCYKGCLAALLAAVALFPRGAEAQDRAALSGHVIDTLGRPIWLATVSVNKLSGDRFVQSQQTNREGQFSFDALPDGDYLVETESKGFVSESLKPIRVVFPSQVRRDFRLEVAPANEGGIYTSSELVGELFWHGDRFARANVCLTRTDAPEPPHCTVTNRLGQYFLSVPPGTYDVSIDDSRGLKAKHRIDMSRPDQYRNKITPETR